MGSARRPEALDVAAVVVTYNAAAWVERCLDSLSGVPTVVVDSESTDGTPELVEKRFPGVRVLRVENRGLGAGWNAGIRATQSRYVLLINSDAWLVGDALARLTAFADRRPEAAVIGPRLLNPDGSLQRSVRGFPTLWRLATEYLFLRKLAPRSGVLNAFYAGGFDHDEVREAEFVMGACLLVRRSSIDQVGLADEDFFLFSEETDWCYRFRQAGWQVVFFPGAECVHVGAGSHAGRLYRQNLRGHLLFFWKHRGRRQAELARRLLLVGVRIRARLFRGERAAAYRDAAEWLASGHVETLLAR